MKTSGFITNENTITGHIPDQEDDRERIRCASAAITSLHLPVAVEHHEALHRAMELCIHGRIHSDVHFGPLYACSDAGIEHDLQLSFPAHRIACLNGPAFNSGGARMQHRSINDLTEKIQIWTY